MKEAYFDHEYASNSDLKKLMAMQEGKEMPENIDEIFRLGTLIHAILLEPHKADRTHPQYELAKEMSKTILKDNLCRQIIMMHDFKREHEIYKKDVHGVKARCKVDGKSEAISTVLEYKGLAVTTDKQFEEAIYNFDYDQGAAWYLDVSGCKNVLIAAPSKKDPRLLFKRLINRDHIMYRSGEIKVVRAVETWKMYFN